MTLTARIGLNYPKDAKAAATLAKAGGASQLGKADWDRLMKRVEPGEDCSDLPAGDMRDWLIVEGHVVATESKTPNAAKGKA
jgi:hypothetical protein